VEVDAGRNCCAGPLNRCAAEQRAVIYAIDRFGVRYRRASTPLIRDEQRRRCSVLYMKRNATDARSDSQYSFITTALSLSLSTLDFHCPRVLPRVLGCGRICKDGFRVNFRTAQRASVSRPPKAYYGAAPGTGNRVSIEHRSQNLCVSTAQVCS